METKMYKNISLMANPVKKEHLVNKKYVDDAINKKVKDAVVVVCTDDLDATYDSVQKTLTQNNPTPLVIDDIAVAINDRVLVTGQIDKTQNGIYVVTAISGTNTPSTAVLTLGGTNTGVVTDTDITVNEAGFEAAVSNVSDTYVFTYSDTDTSWMLDGNPVDVTTYGITIAAETPADGDTMTVVFTASISDAPAVLTRAEDFYDQADMVLNVMIPVQRGTQNEDTTWIMTNDTLPVIDASPISFTTFKAAEGVSIFKTTFSGNGADKEFNISHGLGTENVTVGIIDATTKEMCYFGIRITTENVVTIVADVILEPTDTFEVVIMG